MCPAQPTEAAPQVVPRPSFAISDETPSRRQPARPRMQLRSIGCQSSGGWGRSERRVPARAGSPLPKLGIFLPRGVKRPMTACNLVQCPPCDSDVRPGQAFEIH